MISKGLSHAIADCRSCGKHWENYVTAQRLAAIHAKQTGHHVVIDLGFVVEYGHPGKKKKFDL